MKSNGFPISFYYLILFLYFQSIQFIFSSLIKKEILLENLKSLSNPNITTIDVSFFKFSNQEMDLFFDLLTYHSQIEELIMKGINIGRFNYSLKISQLIRLKNLKVLDL